MLEYASQRKFNKNSGVGDKNLKEFREIWKGVSLS